LFEEGDASSACRALPAWINTGVELIKGSSPLSIIGVGELLLKTQEVIGRKCMTIQFSTRH
jgi:polar amino acid transport system permease protein